MMPTPDRPRVSWVGIGATLLLGVVLARYALRRDAAVSALATQIESAMTRQADESSGTP